MDLGAFASSPEVKRIALVSMGFAEPPVSGSANMSEAVIRVEFGGGRADTDDRVVFGGDGRNPESLAALIDEVNRYLASRDR